MFKPKVKKQLSDSELRNKYSLFNLQEFVSNYLEHLRTYEIDDKREDYRRRNLIKISKNCGKGDLGAKLSMKSYILDLICNNYGVNEDNINMIIDFYDVQTAQEKFDILLYVYKKEFKYKALETLIEKYNLSEFREVDGEISCSIIDEDIDKIYEEENPILSFEDKLNIIVQYIYQNTKGLGAIDEIRDQFCDGLSLGVSGVPFDFVSKLNEMTIKDSNADLSEYKISYDSIWLYYKGKEVHLKFSGFRSQHELERICRLMYQYKDAPQLTRRDGYGFNHMADLSRISVFRPPFSEGWCAFLRKFDFDPSLNSIITGNNCEMVIRLVNFIAKSKQKIAVTGQQGTGKTTLLIAVIKKMYANVTLRIWEDYFESFLRMKMPTRNIMTIKRTGGITGEQGLDSLKKSNGQMTIISEVAEDEVIKYIMKVALAASESIYFTNHSNSADELVSSFVDGLINTGASTNEEKAEVLVLKALDFDIHLYKSAEGVRCIERITEFVILDDDKDDINTNILESTKNATQDQKMDMLLLLMSKMVDNGSNKRHYKAVDIIRYDFINNKYIMVNDISENRKNDIVKKLIEADKEKFLKFLLDFKSDIIKV